MIALDVVLVGLLPPDRSTAVLASLAGFGENPLQLTECLDTVCMLDY